MTDRKEHSILPECVEKLTRLDEGQRQTHDNFNQLFENHLPHMQNQIDRVDARLWWILGVVILGALISIGIKLYGG